MATREQKDDQLIFAILEILSLHIGGSLFIMQSTFDLFPAFDASSFSVTLSLFFICLGLLYWYSVYPFSVLSQCGIKHPKVVPFYGNLFMFRKGFLHPLRELIMTHGKVCGYYLGRRPVVMVADPDMLRQVLVKDFSSFPNRMVIRFDSKPKLEGLFTLKNEQWKRVRGILTPSFSAAKMKEMVPLINTAADSLMNNLNKLAESGAIFDIHKSFGCFSMDVIASVAFGTQVDSQNDPDDPFVKNSKMFFSFTFFRPILMVLIAFPFLKAPLEKFIPNNRHDQMNQFFTTSIERIIQQREEQPPSQRRRDFLQLMLDARTSKDCASLEHFDTATNTEIDQRNQQTHSSSSDWDNPHTEESPARRPQKKMMTEDEIVAQATVFLLAGYETSSNTLAFTCHLLALHPECQRKVQEEVDEFFTRYSLPDYANVQELKYLEMVVSESLRLFPPAFGLTRYIENDCVVNGQALPKGATLDIPVGFLHRDPDHWPEPDEFIPERFTPEAEASRHPFVYLPFGAGPRNCVGMRLAQLEIRIALVHLFRRFNIIACSETKVPLELNSERTLEPKNGIFVKIEKREVVRDQPNSPSYDSEAAE